MKNILKDIKNNCNQCDIDQVIEFLKERGDFSYTSETHREIYFFYLETLKEWDCSKEYARLVTCEMFDICESNFYKIIKKYR